MPGLMQENARTGIKKIAGETLFSHALKQEIVPIHGLRLVRQIVYPEVKAGRKEWKLRECERRNTVSCRGKIF